MKVTVRLVQVATGRARSAVPDGELSLELGDGATAADVIGALPLPGDEPYAMIVDGRPLPPEKRAGHRLRGGESVVIFPPIEGG